VGNKSIGKGKGKYSRGEKERQKTGNESTGYRKRKFRGEER